MIGRGDRIFAGWLSTALLLALPSVIWSASFREAKLVADPLIILCLELMLQARIGRAIRTLWFIVSVYMLLLEWNIVPSAYLFYLGLLGEALDSQPAAGFFVAIALGAVYLALPGPDRNHARPLLLMGLSGLYLALVSIRAAALLPPERFPIRFPLLHTASVIRDGSERLLVNGWYEQRTVPRDYLYDRLRRLDDRKLPPKLMVVVLESWGESKTSLASFAARTAIGSAKLLASGLEPFEGSTLPGEYRVLCGRQLDLSRWDQTHSHCLPQRLGSLGYKSLALHGYRGAFYYRHLFYPALGFREARFKDGMRGLPICKSAFVGRCDDGVIELAVKRLADPGKRFIHVVSLDAHQAVSEEVKRRYGLENMARADAVSQQINRAVILHTLASMRARDWPAGSLVYFVGDHNPPGATDSSITTPGEVPYLLFSL